MFGKENNKGLRIVPGQMALEVVTVGQNGVTQNDISIHDETNKFMAHLLADMKSPVFPTAIGVLYCNQKPTYETAIHEQLNSEIKNKPEADLNALLRQGSTWTVD